MAGEPSRRKVIKKVSGHGHHGGAWKVAYADFVTAMMALFMVMWLLASTDAASRKEISNYFRSGILAQGDLAMKHAAQLEPSILEESPAPPKPGEGTLSADTGSNIADQMKDRLARLASVDTELESVMKHVSIRVTDDGVLIEAVDSEGGLLFDSASAKLKEPLERFLRVLAPAIAMTGAPIAINGHTDARPFAPGATMSNWDLSYNRASAAREILESSGVQTGQITGVYARGSSQLYVPTDPTAAANRRLSILVTIARPHKAVAKPDAAPVPQAPETPPAGSASPSQ